MIKCVIVHYGRNDSYHEDYLQRTSYCLDHNLSRIRLCATQVDLSIVFVDFLGSNPALSQKLRIQRANQNLLQFIEFSNTHNEEGMTSDRGFSTAIAANIAIRHIDADYYIIGASDLIGSSTFWALLPNFVQNEMSKDRFSFIPRRYLPREFLASNPTSAELEYLMDHTPIREERISKAYGNSGWMCGSAKFFLKAQGWNESFKGWGGDDTEMALATAGFSTPALSTDSHALRLFKWPYAHDGARKSNQHRAINPFELTGVRKAGWGHPNRTLPRSKPQFLLEEPPEMPKVSNRVTKRNSVIYWLASIRRNIGGFNDLRNSYEVAKRVQAFSGFGIATIGSFSLAEWLTICFFRRFSVILCFLRANQMPGFVRFLHRLDSFMSRLDRDNTFNGVAVPINLDIPSTYNKQHAYHRLVENRKILVLARSADGKFFSEILRHDELFKFLGDNKLLQFLGEQVGDKCRQHSCRRLDT